MAECRSESASPTVHELISQLRSSFLAEDFQNVTKALVEREHHMKELCVELGKKSETLTKEKDFLALEIQKLKDKSKKKQKEFDALRKENVEYKDQIISLKSEKSKTLKLEDELTKKQSEIDKMKKMIAEFEPKQAELTFYKKQSADLHDRVSKLENTAKDFMSPGETSLFDKSENKQQKNGAPENIRPPLHGEKGDNKKITEPKLIIQIDDDDDDEEDEKCISTLKRKRVSDARKREYNSDFTNNIQTKTQKTKNLQDLENQPKVLNSHSTPRPEGITQLTPRNLMPSLNSCDTISDPKIKNVNEGFKSLIAKMKMKKINWKSKVEMVEEFDKNDEICVNAICALYRKSRTLLPIFDVSRIKELAQLLTDGDPQQKVKKTASELTRADLDDCRKFAKKYSIQLFNIFQKKDDPFFPLTSS